jgi:hypothetical protein
MATRLTARTSRNRGGTCARLTPSSRPRVRQYYCNRCSSAWHRVRTGYGISTSAVAAATTLAAGPAMRSSLLRWYTPGAVPMGGTPGRGRTWWLRIRCSTSRTTRVSRSATGRCPWSARAGSSWNAVGGCNKECRSGWSSCARIRMVATATTPSAVSPPCQPRRGSCKTPLQRWGGT